MHQLPSRTVVSGSIYSPANRTPLPPHIPLLAVSSHTHPPSTPQTAWAPSSARPSGTRSSAGRSPTSPSRASSSVTSSPEPSRASSPSSPSPPSPFSACTLADPEGESSFAPSGAPGTRLSGPSWSWPRPASPTGSSSAPSRPVRAFAGSAIARSQTSDHITSGRRHEGTSPPRALRGQVLRRAERASAVFALSPYPSRMLFRGR